MSWLDLRVGETNSHLGCGWLDNMGMIKLGRGLGPGVGIAEWADEMVELEGREDGLVVIMIGHG